MTLRPCSEPQARNRVSAAAEQAAAEQAWTNTASLAAAWREAVSWNSESPQSRMLGMTGK